VLARDNTPEDSKQQVKELITFLQLEPRPEQAHVQHDWEQIDWGFSFKYDKCKFPGVYTRSFACLQCGLLAKSKAHKKEIDGRTCTRKRPQKHHRMGAKRVQLLKQIEGLKKGKSKQAKTALDQVAHVLRVEGEGALNGQQKRNKARAAMPGTKKKPATSMQ